MRRILLMALVLLPLLAAAKKKGEYYGKGTGRVYLFGVCQQLTDSVVYITNIHEMDSLDLDRKTGYLPFRSEFSLQLKEYMEGTQRLVHQTACVFFSDSRKKLSKKFYKIKKRFLDNPYTKVVMIDEERFRFRHPLDSFADEDKK